MSDRAPILTVAVAAILAGCGGGAATFSEAGREALYETIAALGDDYSAAMGSLDPERVASFYAEDPDFRVYIDGQVVSRDELIDVVTTFLSSLQSFDADFVAPEVTALGPDVALHASRFQREYVSVEGDTIVDWGTSTWVWTRRAEGWRLIHGHGVHYPGPLP